MSIKKVSTFVSSAVLIALASANVQATDRSLKQTASKEQKIGMATGTTIGAIIGGPFGAAVGFIVGAISGVGAEQVRATANHAKQLEQELAAAQNALAKTNEKSPGDPLIDQLVQRLRADVMFRTNSAELDDNASSKLAALGTVLAGYPNLAIELDGFADPRGKSDANVELSQQRAAAVRAALLVGGAASDRIKIAAHGAELNTAIKGDLEAYAWERRVSLAIVPANDTNAVAQAR